MKRNGNSSGKPFNPGDSFPDFRAPIAPEVVAKPDFPRSPKFPTVEELLDQEHPHPFLQLVPTPAPRPPSYGLLQELLGGRLEVLVADAARHPERYDEDTRELLEALGNEPLKLQQMNPTEQQMLNRAVIDFAAFRPRAPAAPAPQKPRIPKVLEDLEDEDGRAPEEDEHGPGNTMSSYWWLA